MARLPGYQRLVRVPLSASTKGVRLICQATWGDPVARIFSLEALDQSPRLLPTAPDGPAWTEVVAKVPAKDLANPDSGLEKDARVRSHSA